MAERIIVIIMVGEYISIGKILNTQGRHGAVRVLPLTDYPERFSKMAEANVLIRGSRRILTIEDAYPYKKYIVIKFKQVNDMKTAEELKGGLLEITRSELTALPQDSFYIFDIIDLDVYDAVGRHLGKIAEVLQTGANDVYLIETGGKPLLIPALKQVVKEVDLTGRRMTVELPKGLTDDED